MQKEKEIGLNLRIIREENFTTFAAARQFCKEYLENIRYVLKSDAIHYISIEGPRVTDLIRMEFINYERKFFKCEDAEYGKYFQSYRDLAIVKNI